MDWLPKPKVEAEGFENNILSFADVRIRGRVRTNLLKNYITLWALYFRKVVESRYVWWCDVWFFMAAL